MKNKPNRLINEKSPYLRAHAYNPVDWYPWDEEAFARAREENKPVFLSIGYSSCHWCHVMEKESFEDEEIAEILNRYFVAIKVDREERPDIDSIYMNVSIMMTGGGGWPLTVFLTPEKKPFFAGTYFPKESMYGRIGLKDLLTKIVRLWEESKERLLNDSEAVLRHLKEYISSPAKGNLNEDVFVLSCKAFQEVFDPHYGGFGYKPKFPSPHNFLFLLRYYSRVKEKRVLDMVEHSLQKMRLGGIFDHIGSGFHRYSTDERWLLPHFEKMLYDQALLAMAYAETYQLTKKSFYREVVEEILEYVKREMMDRGGGFYSAEDADSEDEEGKFYLWSYAELRNVLGEDFPFAEKVFNIRKEGNYREEATGYPAEKNILYMERPYKEFAEEIGISENELKEKMSKIKERLFEARGKRIHPLKDTKILTDWNGLMISAFSIASQVLANQEYAEIAKKAADFIISEMKTNNQLLLHRYKDGEVKFYGNISDYAFLVWGLIETYHASFEEKYLREAIFLTDKMIEHFWDSENAGFFITPDFGENLIVRPKETYEGAIPSGSSVAAYNLLRLYRITGKQIYKDCGIKTIESIFARIKSAPTGYSMMLVAYDFYLSNGMEIVFAGEKEKVKEFNRELHNFYIPHKTILFKESESLSEIAPYTESIPLRNNAVDVYLCSNFTCQLALDNLREFKEALSKIILKSSVC